MASCTATSATWPSAGRRGGDPGRAALPRADDAGRGAAAGAHGAVAGRRLLLRIGDAAGGFGFPFSKVTDRVVALFRTGRWRTLHCRTLREWCALLERLGFTTTAIPMSAGTPFANTLLLAEAR